jgi:MFS family permease
VTPAPSVSDIWQQIRGHPLRAFLIGLVGLTLMNVDHSLFAFVLTEFSEEFGWSIVERGWYIAITFMVAGIMITQFGVLADRVGRKLVIFWSTLLTPLLVALLFLVPNTWLLLVARAAGFGVGAVQSPVTSTLVLEEAPPRLRGLMSGTLQIGYPIGFFLASLVVPTVYENFGWRYIFLLPLVFLPFAWVVLRYLRDPPAFEAARAARAGAPPPVHRNAVQT